MCPPSRLSQESNLRPVLETTTTNGGVENCTTMQSTEAQTEPNKKFCPTKCQQMNKSKTFLNIEKNSKLNAAETQKKSTISANIQNVARKSNKEKASLEDVMKMAYKAYPDLIIQQCRASTQLQEKATLPIKSVKDCFKVCGDCHKTHNSNLQKLFKMCEDYPDDIINAYRSQYLTNSDKSATLEGFYGMNSTHGEVLGDPKYHYLMVDASTSVTQVEESQHSLQKEIDLTQISILSTTFTEKSQSLTQTEESKPHADSDKMKSTKVSHFLEIHSNSTSKSSMHSKDESFRKKSSVTSNHGFIVPKKSSLVNKQTPYESKPVAQEEIHKDSPDAKIGTGVVKIRRETNVQVSMDSLKEEDQDKEIKTSSNDESFERRSSTITWSDFNREDDIDNNMRAKDKQRVEEVLTQIKAEQSKKSSTKDSILCEVIKTEKRKSELSERMLMQHLQDSESESTDSTEELGADKKAKCCGLIKGKKKIPQHKKKSVTVRTAENVTVMNKHNRSPSGSGNSSLEYSNVNKYRRRSSPVEHPVFEKNQEIKQYSSNL